MMASNVLFLPFRRTHAVSMSDAIKQYISTKYNQHPDMFKQDLLDIDRIRADAVNFMENHISGIRKLTAYAAHLVWMGGKFPVDIGVEFTWYPALGFNTQTPVSQNNLRFELANVLYNLASLYSQLACSQNPSTSEGLKSACNYFCQAAGVISHIKTEIIPDLRTVPPEDMDLVTLESIQQLLLAQAQECFWSKAVKDGMKDGLIAKLAAKVSDFYDQAAEYGIKSDVISTEWLHHMAAKHHHFAAAAQYRASRECLEKQNYGEEVARLRDSLVCVAEGLKESRWINKVVLGDLNGLRLRVVDDLKRAEKDNDVIYLMPVPDKSELKTLGRAGMATPRVPSEVSDPLSTLGEKKSFGQPLFTKLVPYAVHVAVDIYAERRDRVVNTNIINELESSTEKLRELLRSLNLPGSLQAIEKPLGLPLTLTSHAEEVRQQQGLHQLRRSIHEISKLKINDTSVFQEGVDFLRSEAAEDERAKTKHGTDRWIRQPSQQAAESLYAQVTEINGYLESAQRSDELVKSKLKESEEVIRILSGSNHDLEEFVPNSRGAAIPPQLESATTNLRNVLNEVNRMDSRRKRYIMALQGKALADDINSAILEETARFEREFPMQKIEPAQFENLFEERLRRYDVDHDRLSSEQDEQKHIISLLREANAAFTAAKHADSSTKRREQALQKLENAYIKYKEVISNLDKGRKFYNDLAKIVDKFRTECKNFAYQRRAEAAQLENDLSSPFSNLVLSPRRESLPSQKPQHQENLHPVTHSQPSSSHATDEPITAPKPTRAPNLPSSSHPTSISQPIPGIWSPEMGIKFGAAAPSPPANSGKIQAGQWDAEKGF